jgi:chromate transporter
MVVAFVGFVGGYVRALFGPDALFLAGAVAACLVTWFTFLPSFVFILAGGPMVEMTHNQWRFTVPLSGITAAVVGGFNSLPGAALGGLLIGLVETFVSGTRLSTFRDAIAFGILIAILLFRPAGLLGKLKVEKV